MAYVVDQVVNEGTQWEYSLSVPIRQLINNNLFTAANIEEYVFAGLTDNRVNYIANVEDPTTIDTQTKNRNYNNKYNQTTFLDWSENVPNEINYQNGTELSEFTFYQRNVLVAPATPGSTALGLDTLRLVLDIKDIKNWMMDFDTNSVHSQVTLTSDNGQTGNGYSGTAYHWGSAESIGPTITTRQTTGAEITKGLHVATITIINNELWFGYLNPSNNHNEFYQNQGFSRRLYNIYGASSQTNQYRSGKRGMWTQSAAKYSMYPAWNNPIFPPSSDIGVSSVDKLFYNVNANGVVIDCAYKYNNANDGVALTSCSAASGYLAKDYNTLLTWLSWCGLYFKIDNITYKPIINGGVITGYTSDMSRRSEFDNLSNVTGNNVPDTPPGPTPGPYDDDPWSGATFAGTGVGGAGAFAKVYYMTSTELANLRSWMNSINVPEGFDPMQQIIGLSQVPVALSGSGPENVVFVNSSAVYDPGVTTRAVDTGVATQQSIGTPISYYLGSVDIVRRMQERGEPYLDYDCQIELYLPLIGMFSLDTQAVMGRTISAYAVLDPVSGTLAAYAYVSRDGQNLPIAYGSTTIGVDLPISAQQLSVSRAALKQANAQLGASLLSGALTMLAAASSGKSSGSGAKTSTGSSGLSAAGIREAGSDYMKASQVGNVFGDFMNWGRTIRQLSYGNNTAVAGSFGGSTAQWSYPFTPYVKIIRPRYEKPSNYAHSQGVPCVQTKTIGSCTGFIQCIGADVSGITGATDLELQAIQAALSNGIYAGGGQ